MEYAIISHVAAVAAGSVLITGVAVAACAVLRRVSASFRYLVLVGMFVSLLALPAMSLLMPAWNLPVMPAVVLSRAETPQTEPQPHGVSVTPRALENRTAVDPAETPGGAAYGVATLPTTATDKQPSAASLAGTFTARHLPSIALALWGIGALIVLVVQLVRWAGAGFIAEMATTVENRELLSIAQRIRWEMGIERRVGLLRSDMAAVSMVWGIRHPYVILPSCAASWPAEKVEAVLRHELAHVKRCDNLLQIVAVVACGLYWFNPLVWVAMKRLHFEREVACDNAVLNAGSAASAYAKHLMEISMSLSGPRSRRIIPAVMAHSSDVKKRLLSVLSPGISRRQAGVSAAVVCISLVLFFTLPVSTLRLGPRSAEASGSDALRNVPSTMTAESLVAAERPGAVDRDDDSMKLAGNVRTSPPEEYRYFRGGKLNMSGSYTATGTEVFINEAEILDKKSRVRIEAKNVELDPAATLGCRFEGRGFMRITRLEGRKNITYEVIQRRKDGEYLIETTFSVEGRKENFDEERRREFRDIAAELYNILDIGDDAAEGDPEQTHAAVSIRSDVIRTKDGNIEVLADMDTTGRHKSSMITIHNGRILSDEGIIEVEGTILTEGWSFRGSMEGTWPRVVIVDGTLRNEDADIEIEGRNLVLDPEAEKGFRFNKDKGYMRLTRYAEDAKIEYECRREKKGRKLVTTYECYLDGEQVEPNEKGERELKRILESAYHWLTAGNVHSPAPPAPGVSPVLDAPPAPGASPAPPALPEKSTHAALPKCDARSERTVARERARAIARSTARETVRLVRRERELSADENEPFAEELIEIIEEIGTEFEKAESRFDDRLDSRRAREAIAEAYEAREARIDRIIDAAVDRFRSNPETSIALEGCQEILGEFEGIALSALESCGRGGARSELRGALVYFYVDLVDVVDDIIVELEDGWWGEEGTRLLDAQMTVCREVREALVKTHNRIESFK
jgi:beta-lactamase regulating signal transducer with metallopeptidase domain